jgi:hypothetical protein
MTATRSLTWRTTDRSWAMKISVSPGESRRSWSRFRIWPWIETSSADTGSSATMPRPRDDGACDPDPLPLASRELVWVPVEVLGVEPDALHHLPHLLPPELLRADPVDAQRLPDDRPTVRRGFRDE